MVIDVHAHYVSPRVSEAVRTTPRRYGVTVRETSPLGPEFAFGSEEPIRPMPEGVSSLTARRQLMQAQGVDLQIVSTWMELYAYQLPVEVGARWCRLLNQTLAEDIQAPEHRIAFAGLANVPLQDGDRAAEELEFAVSSLGMRGAMIAPHVLDKPLDDRSLDPLWRTAEREGAVIMVHPYAPNLGFRTNRYYLNNLLANPFDTTVAACCLIFGGVVDRFPDLRVLLVHGGGFLPYQIGRIECGFQAVHSLQTNVARAPREYLTWFHYDTMLLDSRAVQFLVDSVGSQHVSLGSDAPFPISDANPVQTVRQARLGAEAEDRVLRRNAQALFGGF